MPTLPIATSNTTPLESLPDNLPPTTMSQLSYLPLSNSVVLSDESKGPLQATSSEQKRSTSISPQLDEDFKATPLISSLQVTLAPVLLSSASSSAAIKTKEEVFAKHRAEGIQNSSLYDNPTWSRKLIALFKSAYKEEVPEDQKTDVFSDVEILNFLSTNKRHTPNKLKTIWSKEIESEPLSIFIDNLTNNQKTNLDIILFHFKRAFKFKYPQTPLKLNDQQIKEILTYMSKFKNNDIWKTCMIKSEIEQLFNIVILLNKVNDLPETLIKITCIKAIFVRNKETLGCERRETLDSFVELYRIISASMQPNSYEIEYFLRCWGDTFDTDTLLTKLQAKYGEKDNSINSPTSQSNSASAKQAAAPTTAATPTSNALSAFPVTTTTNAMSQHSIFAVPITPPPITPPPINFNLPSPPTFNFTRDKN